jgi:hypothetical protein
MTTWAVLATGPSMSQAVADQVKGRCKAIAVSDAYRLAPWADALASADGKWWLAHPQALEFAGRKYTAAPDYSKPDGVERVHASGTNSALLAAMIAVKLGATRVLLLGVDMRSPGDHFFGRHQGNLKSTTPARMEEFKRHFAQYQPRGVKIVNCSPGSALKCYPVSDLNDCLAEPALHAA